MNDSNWNTTEFFSDLTERNRLARQNDFRFCRVSGLDGFEEACKQCSQRLPLFASATSHKASPLSITRPGRAVLRRCFSLCAHLLTTKRHASAPLT